MRNRSDLETERGRELLRRADVLLVQGEDPWQDPTGGIVAFTKCLLRACGDRVAVASPSEEPMPVGVWMDRSFEGGPLAFFNLGPLGLTRGKKPIVPAKVNVCRRVRKHMRALHDSGVRNLLIDSAEVLFSAQCFDWESACYFFHGLNNPVERSRYPWARLLGRPYEERVLRSLMKLQPDVMLAAADTGAIEEFCKGRGRILDPNAIRSFPTRVDRSVFFPGSRDVARAELELDPDDLTLVANGRLSRTKGWRLLLDVLHVLTQATPAVRLLFVGDGEDRRKIVSRAEKAGLERHVTITGFLSQQLVRRYLNAADVCVVTSLCEGWSLAMLEALACAKPIVSTDVSGAREMVREGHNGFVVGGRDPREFAAAVLRAATLPDAAVVSSEIAERYSIENLAEDLGKIWKPLAVKV